MFNKDAFSHVRPAVSGTMETVETSEIEDQEYTDANLKQHILDVASDSILDFMAYDRKEDDELPRGAIQDAVKRGVISYDEIAAHMRKELERY